MKSLDRRLTTLAISALAAALATQASAATAVSGALNAVGGTVDDNTVTAYTDQQSWMEISDSTNIVAAGNTAQKFGFNGNTNFTQSANSALTAAFAALYGACG